MKFVLAAVAGYAAAMSEIESNFLGYITQFGKSYASIAEYEHRLEQFAMKHSYIQGHNATEESYKLAHNKFSDWTEEEYKSILTYRPEMREATTMHVESGDAASPVDYRNGNCLSPIQDQGQCGSCWAFSSVASLESDWCLANGQLLKLSEQQLVDCVKLCFGCNGGNQALAFNYYKTHFAMSEASYPYTAKDGTCAYSTSNNTGAGTTGYTSVTADSPSAMQNALAGQPLAVAIQANQLSFQLYSSGIFTNTNCGTQLDHATNVVGWGVDATYGDYWIMRNSWGTGWGEQGYMYLQVVAGAGLCGIQMQPLYANPN